MRKMTKQTETLKQCIKDFCKEYIKNPYLCYTEHGIHALFFTRLFNTLSPDQRYFPWKNFQMCTIQKEYPTAADLDKSRRQHWDIALIKNPPESKDENSFDYFKLAGVVEFGLNEAIEHLKDDIDRLCHHEANVEHPFIVHLYRLSQSVSKLSNRDWVNESKRIVSIDDVCKISKTKMVDIYYCMYDGSGETTKGVCHIKSGNAIPIE